MKHSVIVVVGTGTGIGKTHVARALLAAFRHENRTAVGLKPVESGVCREVESDQELLARASGRQPESPPYSLTHGVSPHLAARRDGARIELATLVAYVDAHRESVCVVETAGGLLSPLSETLTNLDLAAAVRGSVVVVSTDRLGVLHDVASVLLALASRGLRAGVVALNPPTDADASTGSNASELRSLQRLPVVAFPRAPIEHAETLAAAKLLLAAVA